MCWSFPCSSSPRSRDMHQVFSSASEDFCFSCINYDRPHQDLICKSILNIKEAYICVCSRRIWSGFTWKLHCEGPLIRKAECNVRNFSSCWLRPQISLQPQNVEFSYVGEDDVCILKCVWLFRLMLPSGWFFLQSSLAVVVVIFIRHFIPLETSFGLMHGWTDRKVI